MQLRRNDAARRLSPDNGTKIYTVWPANRHGKPGGDWRQSTRWLVLDVTDGLDKAKRVAGPLPRETALAYELDLRVKQRNT